MPQLDGEQMTFLHTKTFWCQGSCRMQRKASVKRPVPALSVYRAHRTDWDHFCGDRIIDFVTSTRCWDVVITDDTRAQALHKFRNHPAFGAHPAPRQAPAPAPALPTPATDVQPPAEHAAPADMPEPPVPRIGRRGGVRLRREHDDRELTNAQERAIGKQMWAEVAAFVPRPQHDGTLKMPTEQGNARVDGNAFRRKYPRLPYMFPEPAETRAHAALRLVPSRRRGGGAGGGGGENEPAAQRVRQVFEADAMGVSAGLPACPTRTCYPLITLPLPFPCPPPRVQAW